MRKFQKTITTLTRLNHLQLDQLRLQLSELLKQQQNLNDRVESLDSQAEQERQWSSHHIDKAQNIDAFIKKVNYDKVALQSQLEQIEQNIENLLMALQDRYQERKRYEVVSKNHHELQSKNEARLEQKLLDDLAIRKTER